MPITPASLRAFQVFQKSMRLPSTLFGQRLEAHQFGETVAAVATHRQHEAHQYQQHAGEGEDEVGQLRNRHQQVRQGGGNQGAQGDLEGVATATLFPGDGQPLDGQLVTEQADYCNDDDHEGQHDRQARQHLQFEMLEIGAQRQTQCGDQSEQHYAPADLGLTECQGDQDRGEGTQGLDADQVAQDQDHQYPDRDHDHHLVDLLGLQRQAVQGVFEQRRGAGLGGHLGQAQGVRFTVVDGEADGAGAATLQLQQRQIAGPPHQTVVRNALLAGFRVEVQPALAVVAAQPQLGLLIGGGFQADGVYQLQRDAGVGQQQIYYPRLVQRGGLAVQQQPYVVVGDVVDAADGLADEGLDIRRMLPNRVDQGVCSDLFRTVQGDRLSGRRGTGLDRLGAIALGQYQTVVETLGAAGPTGGPGDTAVAVQLVDADTIVVGDEALVERHVFLVERGDEQLRLDRNAGGGSEIDLRIQTPDIVGFVLADGNLKYPDLVTGNQQTQTDHDENQYFEMRIDRLHGVLSGSFRLLLHSLDRSGTGSDWTGAIVARQTDRHPVSKVPCISVDRTLVY